MVWIINRLGTPFLHLYLFVGVGGSVTIDDSTQCGDNSLCPMHNPKLPGKVI